MMDDELYHHGIKGMRWGVRRFQNPDGTLTEAGKKRERLQNERAARKAVKANKKWASKNRSLLSDDELNERINRLQKEKLFRTLSSEELSPGRSEASKLLKQFGTQAISVAIGSVVGGVAGTYATTKLKNRMYNQGYKFNFKDK